MTSEENSEAGNDLSRRFRGKVAFITGPSDRGIGGAIAERLANEGADIVLAGLESPRRLIRLLEKLPVRTRWVTCDVTSTASVNAALAECTQSLGRLDVLVNNAGVEFCQPLAEMTDDQWLAMIDVNLNGAFRCSRAALSFLSRPGGVIVNISSILAIGGCPGYTGYGASKAGLNALTQAMAWEIAPQKLRVVGVAPAMVHTPMIYKHMGTLKPEVERQILASHPLGMGLTHDVAATVAFLASHEAKWITGVTLPLGWAPTFPLPAPLPEE